MKNYPPSLRRYHLDKFLINNIELMKGVVIDIGGKKNNPRGKFRPPLNQVEKWIYINNDASTDPDVISDVNQIPLKSDLADFFICTEVIEYLSNPHQMLNEARRILKKDGKGIITSPFMNPIHGDFKLDKVRYSKNYLETLIIDSGFEIIEIIELGSIGSVIFDSLKVQMRENDSKIFNFILDKSLPFFKMIDHLTGKSRKFVNTGYFVIVQSA